MLELFFSALLQFSFLTNPTQDVEFKEGNSFSRFNGRQNRDTNSFARRRYSKTTNFSSSRFLTTDTTSTNYGGGGSWDDNN